MDDVPTSCKDLRRRSLQQRKQSRRVSDSLPAPRPRSTVVRVIRRPSSPQLCCPKSKPGSSVRTRSPSILQVYILVVRHARQVRDEIVEDEVAGIRDGHCAQCEPESERDGESERAAHERTNEFWSEKLLTSKCYGRCSAHAARRCYGPARVHAGRAHSHNRRSMLSEHCDVDHS